MKRIVHLLAVLLPTSTGLAQVLSAPPLSPGESELTTAQGCLMVVRPPPPSELGGKWDFEAAKREWAEIEFKNGCRKGELLVGPYTPVFKSMGGARSGFTRWYDFGRRFGIDEYNLGGYRKVDVQWQGRTSSFPIGIETRDELARALAKGSVSVQERDANHSAEVLLSQRMSLNPKAATAWELDVRDDGKAQTFDCPSADPGSCLELWQKYGAPMVSRGQKFLDETRPRIEARKAALTAHLRATLGAAGMPAELSPKAAARAQNRRKALAAFTLVNDGLPTQLGFQVDLYPDAPDCRTTPERVVDDAGRSGTQPSTYDGTIALNHPVSFVMRSIHAGADGKRMVCSPGAMTFVAAGEVFQAVFHEEGSSCWMELYAEDDEGEPLRRVPVTVKPLKIDSNGQHSCDWVGQ